jgi:hypothetical protein
MKFEKCVAAQFCWWKCDAFDELFENFFETVLLGWKYHLFGKMFRGRRNHTTFVLGICFKQDLEPKRWNTTFESEKHAFSYLSFF